MSLVVGDKVVQGKAIVGGDKVDTAVRLAVGLGVQIGAGHEPLHNGSRHARIPFDKAAQVIPKFAVPLRPAVADKRADLVKPGRIPRLGDDFCA